MSIGDPRLKKLQDLKSDVGEYKSKIVIANKKIGEIEVELFLEKSHFKIGDVVIHDKHKIQITSCEWSGYSCGLRGRKILKDGSLHKTEQHLYFKLTAVGDK